MAGLHAVQTALDQSVLNPIEPSSTRWLSMEASVRRLKDTFVSVLISLEREGEERGDAKAIGLFHLMSTYRFISTMLLLCDLLPHVSNLSKALQASDFEHSLVKPLVSSTVSTLRQLKTVDGENLRSLPDLLDTLEKSDVTVKQRADDHDFFTEHVKGKYIDRLMSNIEQRFPSEDVGLLSHFAIFDPHRMQVNQTADYGQEEVKSLSEHFLQKPDQPNVTADAVNEWTNFRNFAKDSVLKQPDLKAQSIIDLLCTKSVAQHAFPHLSKLAKIYRVLPCHTADAERTFSQLKIIKTVPRNRLNQASLDGLIRIAVDGPPVHEFDYQSTVQRWAQKKNRRLCRK
ncbi:uncharacterized protein C17orf113-like [Ptychodera flava]|uniref:uncharacterized protein C17orf113-like n=1 Tax=Ptychodera flava TaxID=63121 RepID=UPI00396A5E5D